jgi:hypothetical protein
MRKTKSTFFACVAILLSPMAANADVIILDADNGYLVELEPGVLIEQPEFEGTFNYIFGTNVQFSIDGMAWYDGIGGGWSAFSPVQLVNNNTELFLQTAGGNLYSGFLTYFVSWGSGAFGTHPGSGNNVGAALDLVAVPEPGALALLAIGLFGMGLAKRRKSA